MVSHKCDDTLFSEENGNFNTLNDSGRNGTEFMITNRIALAN